MPVPPRPGVAGTDAVAGFDGWLARAPRLNRIALRGSLLALGLRVRGMDRGAARRGAGAARPLARARGAAAGGGAARVAAAAYYGDDGVMRGLGYDAGERVRRGRVVRDAVGDAPAPPTPRAAGSSTGRASAASGSCARTCA